jgi:hypothetical protein
MSKNRFTKEEENSFRDKKIKSSIDSEVSLFDVNEGRTILTLSSEEAAQVERFVTSLRQGCGWNSDKLKDAFVDRFTRGLSVGEDMGLASSTPVLTATIWPSHAAFPLEPKSSSDKAIERSSTAIVDSLLEENLEQHQAPDFSSMPDTLGPEGEIVSTGGALSVSALNMAFAALEHHSVIVSAVVLDSFRWADLRNWGRSVCNPTPYEVSVTRGVFGRMFDQTDLYVRNITTKDDEESFVWCLSLPDERYPRGLASKVRVCTGL